MPQRPLACLLALLLLAPAAAQDAQQPEQIFRAETELVLVPVTVTERGGQHVKQLSRNSFTVRLNRRPVQLTLFEEVTAAEAAADAAHERSAASSAAHWPADYSNARSSSSHQYHSILLLDFLNSGRGPDTFADRSMAMDAVLDFLAGYSAEAPVQPLSFYLLGRAGLVHLLDVDRHPGALLEAIRLLLLRAGESGQQESTARMPPDPDVAQALTALETARDAVREDVGMATPRQRTTLPALRSIAERYQGIPGRKSLLWITGGMPLPYGAEWLARAGPGWSRDQGEADDEEGHLYPLVERTWRALSSAQISAYPVDMRGLVLIGHDIRPRLFAAPASVRRPPDFSESRAQWYRVESLKATAEATGGRAFYGRNDLAVAVREAMEESRSYYLLGFYVPKNALRPGWQSISVSLRGRSGTTLRYRRGFYARPGSSPAEDWEHNLRTALASPVDLPGIPLTARLEPGDSAGEGKRQVTVHLNIAAGALTVGPDHLVAFDTVVTARGATGGARSIAERRLELRPEPADLARLQQGGINYSAALELEGDDRVLRVVVHDRSSGRLGTLTIPLAH